jgi:coenzyme F420-reducing hydrogenase beta subunit
MIQINQKENCCGCGACVQICPQQCITFQDDKEGFNYPYVDTTRCIHCNLCTEVCPELKNEDKRTPLGSYVFQLNEDKTRLKSSSGGIFSLLARKIIEEDGIVFGAEITPKGIVKHTYINKLNDLPRLQGSKYVQSDINQSYRAVKHFLQEKKKVLFSGTPCQIAGLRHFLRRDYSHLLLIEIACHGVPSPKVWKNYLSAIAPKNEDLKIHFRNKKKGWNNYSLQIKSCNEPSLNTEIINTVHAKNPYMLGFLHNLYLRPSCHHCNYRFFRSGADITLGDAWGIEDYTPFWRDDKGTSLILIHNTNKINRKDLIGRTIEINPKEAFSYNPALFYNSSAHPQRQYFFDHIDNTDIFKWVLKTCKISSWNLFKYKLKVKIKRGFRIKSRT